MSRYLKAKVKRAVSHVSDFEVAVAHEAKKRGMHGVVCGHIHHAEMRDIDGVLYCNDGDWVESLTALVEHADGHLAIADWSAQRSGRVVRAATAASPAHGAAHGPAHGTASGRLKPLANSGLPTGPAPCPSGPGAHANSA